VTVLEEKAFCVAFFSCNVKLLKEVGVNVKNGCTVTNFVDSVLADRISVFRVQAFLTH
jgi:hypothetical protein